MPEQSLDFSFLIHPIPLTQSMRQPGVTYRLRCSACMT